MATNARLHNFAREYIAEVLAEEAKPVRFRGDRDEPKVPIALSLNEADALLTRSEAAAIRAINNSRVAHRRHDATRGERY